MTSNTQRNTIIDVKPILLIGSKWLDVVRMQFAAVLAAFFAGVIVSAKHFVSPFFVSRALANKVLFVGNSALPIRGAFARLVRASAFDGAIRRAAVGPCSWAGKGFAAASACQGYIATLPSRVICALVPFAPTSPRTVFHISAFRFCLFNFGWSGVEFLAAVFASPIDAYSLRFPVAHTRTVFRFVAWWRLERLAALFAYIVHDESYTGELGVCQ